MYLSNEHILTLRFLEGFGTVTVNSIAEYILESRTPIADLNDLYVVLKELYEAKRITGSARKFFPDKEALKQAYSQALFTLEKSDSLSIKMVSRFDSAFPSHLLSTVDESGKTAVPLYLFYKGNLAITQKPAVAIIGTREPTPEGVAAGKYIASAFAKGGFNIVSGLAVGCDTSGHEGALSVPGGLTTAIMAHGLDSVYPPQNTRLAESIVANGGLLMSEYPIGTGVNKYNLVARDRLQAALSDALIVIQTSINGGTMHAVNAALAAGKPLYAVTYSKPIPAEKIEGNSFLMDNKGAIGLSASSVKEAISFLINYTHTNSSFIPGSSMIQESNTQQLTFKFE